MNASSLNGAVDFETAQRNLTQIDFHFHNVTDRFLVSTSDGEFVRFEVDLVWIASGYSRRSARGADVFTNVVFDSA